MKALIVDSGLKGFGGHNYAYTTAVRAAIGRLGAEVSVLANKNLQASLVSDCFRPVFSLGAFDFTPGRGRWRDLAYLYAQSQVYADELEAALDGIQLGRRDLVFCHTVADFELVAWSRYLSRRRLRSPLVILLRHTEGFRRCPRLRLWLHPYWRLRPHYLNAIHRRAHGLFALATDSERLSEDYATIFRHRIITLPVPVGFGDDRSAAGGRADHRAERSLRIGYVGDARSSKGFDLLPGLVETTLAAGEEGGRFVIQCSQAPGSPTPGALTQLRTLGAKYAERVELLERHLDGPEYERLVRSLDVVLLPYADEKYRESTSGIFAEALTLGTPVLVTHDTWMADQLRRSRGGLEFRRGDVADMARQLDQLIHGYQSFRDRAADFAGEWAAMHNPDQLAASLLNEIDALARGHSEPAPGTSARFTEDR